MRALSEKVTPSVQLGSACPLEHTDGDKHPEIQAKLAELQSRTIEYNRELFRITGELNEIRGRLSH